MPDRRPYIGPERRFAHADEMRDIIRETVCQTFATLGIDVDKPIELQADMRFMRELRTGVSDIKKTIYRAIITSIATAVTSAIVYFTYKNKG